MRRFFVPPEVRDRADAASPPGEVDPVACTPERLTLASLLLVTVPVTAGLSFMFAPVVLPTTALVAYAFWHLGRRITQLGSMIAYCFTAGALAGVVNAWLTLLLWGLFDANWLFGGLNGGALSLATLLGAGVGLAYGSAYLLPMLIQVSTRSLRRTEAVDRCLAGFGLWGVLVLLVAISATAVYGGDVGEPVLVVALVSASVHASMFVAGVLRWARRRSWLGRVEQGKVPGWLVCDQPRFHGAQLEGLEIFCRPLLDRTGKSRLRVLARGTASATSETYRTTPVAPKYLIV